jgi:hypothetical protein
LVAVLGVGQRRPFDGVVGRRRPRS